MNLALCSMDKDRYISESGRMAWHCDVHGIKEDKIELMKKLEGEYMQIK